jgi:hypothetical protein
MQQRLTFEVRLGSAHAPGYRAIESVFCDVVCQLHAERSMDESFAPTALKVCDKFLSTLSSPEQMCGFSALVR